MYVKHPYGRSGLNVERLVFFQGISALILPTPIQKLPWWIPKEAVNYQEGLSMDNLACWAWERQRMCFCMREAGRSFTTLGVAFEISTGCSSHCCCKGRHIHWGFIMAEWKLIFQWRNIQKERFRLVSDWFKEHFLSWFIKMKLCLDDFFNWIFKQVESRHFTVSL